MIQNVDLSWFNLLILLGYYHSSQSHPFYNAPYHNYQQIPQREVEEDNSSCFSGLYDQFFIISVCVIIVLYILKYYYDFDFNFDTWEE